MSLDPKYDSLWEDVEGDSGSIIFNLTDPAQGNTGMSATIAIILCAADGTIEQQPILPNGTIAPFIDGSQDVRHCGDNRRLIEQMKTYGKTVTTKPFP
ncbi:hypothetical protein COL5a_011982 [Colletotrichum fioriniae]|nr:hypothetical protein COL5a_011982 [Colletotrichum fioriniae]